MFGVLGQPSLILRFDISVAQLRWKQMKIFLLQTVLFSNLYYWVLFGATFLNFPLVNINISTLPQHT